jgi:hypothetical protein
VNRQRWPRSFGQFFRFLSGTPGGHTDKTSLRALRGPARWVDGLTVKDPDESFYVVETIQEMVAHRERVNEVAAAIEMRGVGRAIALRLGNQYNASAGVTADNPKLWLEGLGHTKTKAQRKVVAKAIAEWPDGDSIASHVGYGIDLYCFDDFGHDAGGPTIMSLENRAWLSSVYGVIFLTLSELAEKLEATRRENRVYPTIR